MTAMNPPMSSFPSMASGQVHVDRCARKQAARQREVRREHADDEMRCVLNRDRLTDDVRTAGEPPLPVAVREHHGLRAARGTSSPCETGGR